MRCPICREQIDDEARKCSHCGSYTTRLRRLWSTIRSLLELCTLIAALTMLYFTWQANQGMQEQLTLQRESAEELSRQFAEERRPRIEIILTQISVEDTILALYVDYKNAGYADAENLVLCVVLKYEDSPADTIATNCTRMKKISAAVPQNHRWPFRGLRTSNLTCLIEVRYTWSMGDNYKDEKYLLLLFDAQRNQYSKYLLTEEQIEKLWK